nr:G2/M phase-specific E3 ubiquitin-protein ligase-like [Nothobranchius furzeri]XP_054592855.1 G2/M phase-specific E3 ubiquitin-protein ligase-like [Nothobranchius furzeri]
MERENLPLVEEDVAVLLKQFQEDNLSGLVQKICIRRRKLLDTAIRAMSRLSFSWNDSPEIEFFGEEADDMGGPQREFFRLLMIEVQSTLGIFEGRAGQVFFAYDQSALEQNKFFQGGKLIGWSLAHGGPGIKALDPNLYQMMCGQDPPLEHFNPSLLPDPDVQEKLKRVTLIFGTFSPCSGELG